MKITWRDLHYSVSAPPSGGSSLLRNLCPQLERSSGERLSILNGLTGSLSGGQLTALLGCSGAGKSSLLGCLARYKKLKTSSGQRGVQLDGSITVEQSTSKALQICLVPQQDQFYPYFTVAETLLYATQLKNLHHTELEHESIVRDVLHQLDLLDAAGRQVINLSGGEAKRLSIACELVSNPDVLLLDEPTSGLDISSSVTVISLLASLVHSKQSSMAIMASIHQPSAYLFSFFDHVILLAKGTQCPYEGPPGQIFDRCYQVANCCYESKSKFQYNPADLLIEIAAGRYGREVLERMIITQRKIHESESGTMDQNRFSFIEFEPSQHKLTFNPLQEVEHSEKHAVLQRISVISENWSQPPLIQDLRLVQSSPSVSFRTFMLHTWIIFTRCLIAITHNPLVLFIRIFAHTCLPLIIGLMIGTEIGQVSGCPPSVNPLHLELNEALHLLSSRLDSLRIDYIHLQLNFGMIFIVNALLMILSMATSILTIPMDAQVLRREYRNSWYGLGSFYLGLSAAELPFIILFAGSFSSILYVITGQPLELMRYGRFVIVLLSLAYISQSIGLMVGIIFMDNMLSAISMGIFSVTPFMMLNNFLNRDEVMSWWLRPMMMTSHIYHSFNAIISALYGFNRCGAPTSQPNLTDWNLEDESLSFEADDYLETQETPGWVSMLEGLTDVVLRNIIIDPDADPTQVEDLLKKLTGRSNISLEHDTRELSKDLLHTLFTQGINQGNNQSIDLSQSRVCTDFGVTDSTFIQSIYWLVGMMIVSRIASYFVLRAKLR